MKHSLFFFVTCLLFTLKAQCQTPEVSSWVINPGTATGYGGNLTNVQSVRYSATQVYVASTCIPGYDIGPWAGNPNIPANQNFVFKITRRPTVNTGTSTATGLGHTGIWRNGVSIFNAKDAMSYRNQNVWQQNAYFFEAISFDSCMGHPAPNGEYHHHVNPVCLYNVDDSSTHSPIIGYAFDGFPIYGTWANTRRNGTGPIRRIRSSFHKRNITTRTTLPSGIAASSAGPPVSSTYPVGAYTQDYEYIADTTGLDDHNGRFCITPEYPAGIYAYFVTTDASGAPEYPYTLGPTYYGIVQPGNTGPQSGHAVISEPVTVYQPTAVQPTVTAEWIACSPNPTSDLITFHLIKEGVSTAEIVNLEGRSIPILLQNLGAGDYNASLSGISPGMYMIRIRQDGYIYQSRLAIK